ncbi:HpcH/HpaI aldolase family protein [Subtercola endophyticus]|uniref:HpcH/HpaI aldolase family protein n=1 Tax=Subtercola endophyticus TaxID=2895559 RepID=UPI001E58D3C5|nr:aldolase/citrate lyase family protein [Subtercola endophyticus]UFS58549.1 aldolase/citrate lyase family protein [Subtercola endophyticus]
MTDDYLDSRPRHWREWAQRPAFGLWSCTDSLSDIGMLAGVGFDYLCVDLQHGMLAPADLRHASRLLKPTFTTCVSRVAWNRPELIMQAFDFGAELVIVPMVDSAEAAAAAVECAAYPSVSAPSSGRAPTNGGARSWGPLWPDTTLLPDAANSAVGCLVMVETALALENLDEIAATPGLAGIYIGPNDLALSLGFGRSTYLDEPAIHDALDRVAVACRSNGIIAALHCSSPEMAKYWADRGFSMLTSGTDTSLFATAVSSLASALRGEQVGAPSGGY